MAKFKKGQSGNPKGRPKGIVDRRSRYHVLIEKHVPDVVDQIVSAALGGDIAACKLLLDKVIPSVRSTAPLISLPKSGDTATTQSSAIVQAMLGGSLAPDQAVTAISVLVDHARLCEYTELEARLEELEKQQSEAAV